MKLFFVKLKSTFRELHPDIIVHKQSFRCNIKMSVNYSEISTHISGWMFLWCMRASQPYVGVVS